MPTFGHHDIAVHYQDTGQGSPVILLHAGASSSRQWQKAGSYLPSNYRLLAPDLIGFGETESWSGPGKLTHDHQADLVRKLIGNVCDGPVHLVGHSYGGSTAMRLVAADASCVKSLVLVEPNIVPLLKDAGEQEIFDEYRQVAEAFMENAAAGREEAAWRTFIDLRNGTGTWDALSEIKRAKIKQQTRQTMDGFISNLNNPTTLVDCRKVRVPTLVICGGNTTRPERRITEILAANVPACRYKIIPKAEHMSPLTHPKEVSALILDHLENCDDETNNISNVGSDSV